MTDYESEDIARFGGTSVGENFHCLPDSERNSQNNLEYSVDKCPLAKSGMFGDDWTDTRLACELTQGPDADGRGFGYSECNFKGADYRECLEFRRYRVSKKYK